MIFQTNMQMLASIIMHRFAKIVNDGLLSSLHRFMPNLEGSGGGKRKGFSALFG